jgi:hypothetical protein
MAVAKYQKIEKFVAAPNGEVLGAAMLALPTCIAADEIMPLLQRHGFADIDPGKWYPQQNILSLYRDILEGRSNVTDNLVSIGIKSVETMQFPPEVDNINAMLDAMAYSYPMVHRNTQPGEGTTIVRLGEGHCQIVINTPYPDDVFYGYYWGLMKKYTPSTQRYRVALTNERPDLPGTVYDVQWGANL